MCLVVVIVVTVVVVVVVVFTYLLLQGCMQGGRGDNMDPLLSSLHLQNSLKYKIS